MKNSNVRPALIAYLVEHPNTILSRDQIAEETGLTSDQVRVGIYNLRQTKDEFEDDIEVLASGNTWRYRPGVHEAAEEAVASIPTYSEVGRTKSGSILVQDEDGNVYKLVELDV